MSSVPFFSRIKPMARAKRQILFAADPLLYALRC